MKITFNPSTVAALITPPNNKDITFDLRGRNIFARGVKFQGTDTWRDIKINNVSIDSNILDLQNGSNTTLTNTNGVVTINSTWRPVVDNLTSDSTTSSLSANQGRVLAGLINNHQQIIDMRNYDENYWHPVTVPLPYTGYNKIKVSVQLNSGDKPSWATHDSGFTCNMEIWATAHGWGTTNAETICLNYTYGHCNSNPCGWKQLGYPSLGVLFLRGGSRYKVWTDFDATFTPHDKTYTWTSEGGTTQSTGGPYTSCPGLDFVKNIIYANLNGTAENSDKLDGYHASYSSNTPWGTIPVITTQGFMDIGKHLEFHRDNTTGSDYSTLLTCTGNYSNIVNLPSESGTLALLSQVVSTSDFTWANLSGKLVGNEFNIVNSGFSNSFWFNYLPINDRNSSAAISQYNMGNGNKGLASVYAYRFKTDGKPCMWKDARNYAPFYSTFNGGFEPILDIKTVSGDWSIGSYDSYGNHLVFAFTSDSDFNAGHNGTAQYYLTAGGEFKINTLRLAGSTNANMGVGSTNPQIIFAEGSATQQVALTYTDQDSYRTSKGLKVHSYDGSDDANVWFEVQGYNYSSGYVKNGSSDAYILLGGGGHKPLSEFSLNSSDYLKLTGGTMTGTIRFNNIMNSDSAIVLDYKYSAGGFARDIVSMKNSVYGDANLGALSILCYPNSTSNGFQYIYLGTDKYGGPNNLRIYKDKVTFGNNILIDAGNIGSQTVANAYHLRINSANTWSTWYWIGQSGQPTWLWGCNDGENMYVWNPSNFSVKYATSAGYVSNSLNIFGVSYNGSAAKTVTTSTFVSQLPEGTDTVTDGTMFITSWASNSGFADTNAVNVPYKRKASCLWSYIDNKVSSKYLPLAGGTMNGNARIGHGSGNLYIGNSGNDGWIYTQNIASQKGTDKWSIRESGAAHFGFIHIASTNDNSLNRNLIESDSGYGIHLNYVNNGNVTLCNGGGAVTIGTASTDISGNKLYVNGSEFINGASNVRDHVFANGFKHRSHNSNDSVLLAGGGYSQGVPVRYWAIYHMYIGYSSTDVVYNKRSGNYNFITSGTWESEGLATLDIRFPSGYNKDNTLIFGNGDHRINSQWRTPMYVTITTSSQFGAESQIRVMLSDDSSFNTGFANIYFMCMG